MRLDFAGTSSAFARTASGVSRALTWLGTAMQVYRERRALRGLSDATLKDIGLSRTDAEREAGRSFWDIAHRKRCP